MNIAQVCRAFLPIRGGMETHIHNLSRALVKRDHKVTVYTTTAFLKNPSAHPKEEVVNGIHVKRFKALANMAGFWYTPSLKRALLVDEADVIHVHSYAGYWTYASIKVKEERNVPVILTPYAFYHTARNLALKRIYDFAAGRKILAKVDAFIVFTELEKRMCVEKGIDSVKVFVIPEGIDLSIFNSCTSESNVTGEHRLDGRVILYMGRIDANKGIGHLVEAFPLIQNGVSDAILLIVGRDWGLKAQLEHLAERIRVRENVIFMDEVPHEETEKFYSASDVLVLPSAYESQGLVLCEAMACRKPVVATRVGCIPEIVRDGWNGILVDYGKPDQLAEAIIDTLTDERLAERLAENGHRYAVESLDLNVIVEKVESVYKSLLKRNT